MGTRGRRSSVTEVLQRLEERVHNDIGTLQSEQDHLPDRAGVDSSGKISEDDVAENDSFMKQVKTWLFEEDAVAKLAPSTESSAGNAAASSAAVTGEAHEQFVAEQGSGSSGGCEVALHKVKLLYRKLMEWKQNRKANNEAAAVEAGLL